MKRLIFNTMYLKRFYFFILLFLIINCKPVFSQLLITPSADIAAAKALVDQVLVGEGVKVSNINWSGQFTSQSGGQIGLFTTGNSSTNLGILSGIIMSTGDVKRAKEPNTSTSSKNYFDYFCECEASKGDAKCTQHLPGCQVKDANLEALLGTSGNTYDATFLEFDFIPSSNQINFKYVFASDEYPNYVCSPTNDVFGFFITGPKPANQGGGNYTNQNIALIPGKTLPVSINTVNSGQCGSNYKPNANTDLTNNQYYVNNSNGQTVVYNAFTKVFIAKLDVIPCNSYHIKLAIADLVDGVYDSSVFIEAKSFTIPHPIITYDKPLDTAAIKGCSDAIVTFNLPKAVINDSVINISYTGGTYGTDFITEPKDIKTSLTIPKGVSTFSFRVQPICPGSKPNQDIDLFLVQTSCSTESKYKIKIIDPKKHFNPITATVSPDVVICPGNNANLTITNVAGGVYPPYTYTWSPATGLSNTSGTNVTANPTVNTTYTISIKDKCKTCTEVTYQVKVDVNNLKADISPGGTICYGDTLIAKVSSNTGVAPYKYVWSDNPSLPDSTSWRMFINNNSTNTMVPLNLTVNVSDAANCSTQLNIVVNQVPELKKSITIIPNPVEIFASEAVNFNYTNIPLTWDFGDGSPSVTQNSSISHIYKNDDPNGTEVTYTTKLSSSGCTDTIDVKVKKPIIYKVSNILTLGKGDCNSSLRVEAQGLQTLKAGIYNRWGVKVFEKTWDFTTDKDDGLCNGKDDKCGTNGPGKFGIYCYNVWDGSIGKELNGTKVEEGVYYYVLEPNAIGGGDILLQNKLNGSVTVIKK